MTTRRQVLLVGALGGFGVRHVRAQARAARVGVMATIPRERSVLTPMLVKALADLGFREDAGLLLDYRIARDSKDYSRVVRDLTNAKCDLIVALGSYPAARALRDARSPVPGLFISVQFDPLETGLVSSLARPTGNMTGIYIPTTLLAAKRMEIAREVLPGASRFLIFADSDSRDQLERTKKAAEAQGARLIAIEYDAPPPYDLAAGFEAGRAAGAEAMLGLISPGLARSLPQLSSLLVKYRLPSFVPEYMARLDGALIGYSINSAKLVRRAAEMAVTILKGAKPSTMPIEQLDEYELIVNLKTAKAIGIKIPYSVMVRATKVIE
jgi:putative ABC transport system substrate-binding protein